MTRFIFTNGRPSTHHQHLDYGLKEGFDKASHQVVQKVEEVGFARAKQSRVESIRHPSSQQDKHEKQGAP